MRRLERIAAVLAFLAGGLHLAAGPAHVQEWWLYGLFFFGAAAVQAAYGLLLLTEGIEGWGGWNAVRGRVYVAGAWMTLAIIATWVVSRTVGIPVGPEAFEPEGIGFLDVSSKVVEVALVLVLLRLRRLAGPPPAAPPPAPPAP